MAMASISEDELIAAVQHHFPALNESGWCPLGSGFSSTVLEHIPGEIVVRVARSGETGERMSIVAPALNWLAARLTVAVPEPLWMLPPGNDARLPFGAFAYRKLAGNVLQPETVADGTVESLTEVLISLHSLPISDSEVLKLIGPDEFHTERRLQYEAIRDILKQRLTASELERIEAWQQQPVPSATRTCLIHGDFWYENMLVDPPIGRVSAILDWEGVAIGDPAQDLVPLRYLGREVADDVLKRYLAVMNEDPLDFEHRMNWWWEARDFGGIYLALLVNDEMEVMDGIRKLHEGPILGT